MSRSMIQESRQSRDDLIINLKQNIDEHIATETLLPVWAQTWNKFQADAYSFIVPALTNQKMGEQQTMITSGKSKSPHSFSIAYSARHLKRVISLHSGVDVFAQIRKQITRIFYRISNLFVVQSFKMQPDNLLDSLVKGYYAIQQRLKVIVGCLNLVLSRFITKKGIEDQLYSIVNKQLMNHPDYDSFINQVILEVQTLRNSCLKAKVGVLENENQGEKNIQIINKLALLSKLKVFPYIEYLEQSKKYYGDLLPKIPNNINMFPVLQNLIDLQKMLQKGISADDQKLQNAKKILKNQIWRPIQEQTLLKVLCKQILQQIYDDMIEYVQLFIDFQDNSKLIKAGDEGYQIFLNTEARKQMLMSLWNLTKILQKTTKNDRQKVRSLKFQPVRGQKKYQQNILPSSKLLNRIIAIVSDIKKHIQIPQNPQINTLYKIINFRDHILSIVAECFENDSKYLNAITIAIEQVIVEQQQNFNQNLCSIILDPSYIFPGTGSQKDQEQTMIEESEEQQKRNKRANNKYSYQLFKLTPSKQQFIRKFQQQFSNYIIPNYGNLDLTQQQLFIRPFQKECGYVLSKNIEKMLNDVWRQGQMIYHIYGNMRCRILCQDWPNLPQPIFTVPDTLVQLRDSFQAHFLSDLQNQKKKLKWIHGCGMVVMGISGIQSYFSELQASIIMILGRSYRPIKEQQFKQVLMYSGNDLLSILADLAKSNVLLYNHEAGNYELNYDNQEPYFYQSKSKSFAKKTKKVMEKDNSIIFEALIARILKRKKSVQKTEIARLIKGELKIDAKEPSIEEINNALQKLKGKGIISIEKTRGIVKYLQ